MRAPETVIHFEEHPLADTLKTLVRLLTKLVCWWAEKLATSRVSGRLPGLLEKSKRNTEVVAKESQPANVELAPNGRPLVGPPCVKCGRCFPVL